MDKNNIYKINKENLPERLQNIPQPPKKLYVLGKMPKENTKILCIVGARKHSSYGEEACKKIISGLKGYDICIVSGLALGIDTIAHKSALEAGLQTIAFPGSGLSEKVLYPEKNRKLADEILYKGGAIISEYEMDQASAPWMFPQRNRLMAGISEATIVIEARTKSGTLITSRLAMDYNRDIGAVPGQITSLLSIGPNGLIRDGATPVTCSDDILEMLGLKTKEQLEIEKLQSEKTIQSNLLFNLTENEKIIIEYIQIEPHTSEQLVLKSGLSAREINEAISSLEIEGLIEERGGRFRMI
ncbi:MAG: DNA-processing protein DprA [Patescibacteria group bacterium]